MGVTDQQRGSFTMNPNDLVLVHTGPPGQEMHVVARYLEPGDDGIVWLNANIGGIHLPQMYRLTEIVRDYSPDHHGFCAACRGFGVPEGEQCDIGGEQHAACSSCGGTGREMVKLTIVRPDDSTTEGHVQIDSAAVEKIECDTCRRALTPIPT